MVVAVVAVVGEEAVSQGFFEGEEGGKYPLQKAQSPDIRWAAALQSSKLHLILRGGMVVVVGRVTGGGESRDGGEALSTDRRGGERDGCW